jgi:protein-disulfide isomerase
MRPTRRHVIAAAGAAALLAPRLARAEDARETERSFGHPDARVTAIEYFSLTCTHCAAFSRETMPKVIPALVDTGKVRFVYRDFPLDQIALTAAMVARALPPEQYEPFITSLFASQDRWAFARGINYTEELFKRAALAGMSRQTFDATVKDDGLRTWILTQQADAQKKYEIDSTPTFIINGQKTPGAMGFDKFNELVTAAAPS